MVDRYRKKIERNRGTERKKDIAIHCSWIAREGEIERQSKKELVAIYYVYNYIYIYI